MMVPSSSRHVRSPGNREVGAALEAGELGAQAVAQSDGDVQHRPGGGAVGPRAMAPGAFGRHEDLGGGATGGGVRARSVTARCPHPEAGGGRRPIPVRTASRGEPLELAA